MPKFLDISLYAQIVNQHNGGGVELLKGITIILKKLHHMEAKKQYDPYQKRSIIGYLPKIG